MSMHYGFRPFFAGCKVGAELSHEGRWKGAPPRGGLPSSQYAQNQLFFGGEVAATALQLVGVWWQQCHGVTPVAVRPVLPAGCWLPPEFTVTHFPAPSAELMQSPRSANSLATTPHANDARQRHNGPAALRTAARGTTSPRGATAELGPGRAPGAPWSVTLRGRTTKNPAWMGKTARGAPLPFVLGLGRGSCGRGGSCLQKGEEQLSFWCSVEHAKMVKPFQEFHFFFTVRVTTGVTLWSVPSSWWRGFGASLFRIFGGTRA